MSHPRVCILRAPGTNCDRETQFAFEQVGGQAERVHLFRLLESPQLLREFQVLCLPGGFSYGDDVGAGVVFAGQLMHQLGEAISEFLHRDTLVLGICNGFQVLLKSGILPGGSQSWGQSMSARQATLTWNANGRYTDLWVHLKADSHKCVFLKDIDLLESPIAHAEGRFTVTDDALLDQWAANHQLALRYCTAEGHTSDELLEAPTNPNGSARNLAGLCDPTGRVLGLMPHPERFLFATQHPQWTRKNLRGAGGGVQIFRNAINYFA